MNRVIFLDFDGVLNQGYDMYRGAPSGFDYAVPSCVMVLNALCRATDAQIVVTSSWRLEHTLDELRSVLRKWGVDAPVIGATEDLTDASGFPAARLAEIRHYLDVNPGIHAYVVLDDQDIRLDVDNNLVRDAEIEDRFVRTEYREGLNREHVVLAARILHRLLH